MGTKIRQVHQSRMDSGLVCYSKSGRCQCLFATQVAAHAGDGRAREILELAGAAIPKYFGPTAFTSSITKSDDESVVTPASTVPDQRQTTTWSESSGHHDGRRVDYDQIAGGWKAREDPTTLDDATDGRIGWGWACDEVDHSEGAEWVADSVACLSSGNALSEAIAGNNIPSRVEETKCAPTETVNDQKPNASFCGDTVQAYLSHLVALLKPLEKSVNQARMAAEDHLNKLDRSADPPGATSYQQLSANEKLYLAADCKKSLSRVLAAFKLLSDYACDDAEWDAIAKSVLPDVFVEMSIKAEDLERMSRPRKKCLNIAPDIGW